MSSDARSRGGEAALCSPVSALVSTLSEGLAPLEAEAVGVSSQPSPHVAFPHPIASQPTYPLKMADAPPPALSSSGVASRFVSSSALEEAKQRREQEWKAAYERIGQEPPKQEDEGTYDPRSLFEKLQENKVRLISSRGRGRRTAGPAPARRWGEEGVPLASARRRAPPSDSFEGRDAGCCPASTGGQQRPLARFAQSLSPRRTSELTSSSPFACTQSKKQEAFEEQLKFSASPPPLPFSRSPSLTAGARAENHFRALDEDEISFLDSMIDDTNEEEREKKRLEAEELKGFRA